MDIIFLLGYVVGLALQLIVIWFIVKVVYENWFKSKQEEPKST